MNYRRSSPYHPPRGAGQTRAVLIDAFGTLVGMEPPAPRLARLLTEAGHPFPEHLVAAAMAVEIAHYRAHHLRGRDVDGIAALRRDCAGVLAASLGPGAPSVDDLLPLLLDSLRFHLLPGAVAVLTSLRAMGLRVALVSNWDASLRPLVARLGIAGLLDAVCISAECGVAKPDPRLFSLALERLDVPASRAVHCGDDPAIDGEGAVAAGVRAVILTRGGRPPDPRFVAISRLEQLTDRHVLAGESPALREGDGNRGANCAT